MSSHTASKCQCQDSNQGLVGSRALLHHPLPPLALSGPFCLVSWLVEGQDPFPRSWVQTTQGMLLRHPACYPVQFAKLTNYPKFLPGSSLISGAAHSSTPTCPGFSITKEAEAFPLVSSGQALCNR